eukprot:jgi/Tetstr1/443375/TSEL_031390.t1
MRMRDEDGGNEDERDEGEGEGEGDEENGGADTGMSHFMRLYDGQQIMKDKVNAHDIVAAAGVALVTAALYCSLPPFRL